MRSGRSRVAVAAAALLLAPAAALAQGSISGAVTDKHRGRAARCDGRSDEHRVDRRHACRLHGRHRTVHDDRPAPGHVHGHVLAARLRHGHPRPDRAPRRRHPEPRRHAERRGAGGDGHRLGRRAGGRRPAGAAHRGHDGRDAGSDSDRAQHLVLRAADSRRQGAQAGRGRHGRGAAVRDDGPRPRRRAHHGADRRDDDQHDDLRRSLPGLHQPDAGRGDVVHHVRRHRGGAERRPADQHDPQRGRQRVQREPLRGADPEGAAVREPQRPDAGPRRHGLDPDRRHLRHQRIHRRAVPPRPAVVLLDGAAQRHRRRRDQQPHPGGRTRPRPQQHHQREPAPDVADERSEQDLGHVRQGAQAPVQPARPEHGPRDGSFVVDVAALRHRDGEVDVDDQQPDAGRVRILARLRGLGSRLLPVRQHPDLPGEAGARPVGHLLLDALLSGGRLAPAHGADARRRSLVQRRLPVGRPSRPAAYRQGRRRGQQLLSPLGVHGLGVVRHRVAQHQDRRELHRRSEPVHAVEQRQPAAAVRRGTEHGGAHPGLDELRPPPGGGQRRGRPAVRHDRPAGQRNRLRPSQLHRVQAELQRRVLRAGLVDDRPVDDQLRGAARLLRGLRSRDAEGPGALHPVVRAAGKIDVRVAQMGARLLAAAQRGLRPVR